MICLAISTVLKNTLNEISGKLFVSGGEEIESSEGITQGVSLAMEMYTLSITLLIRGLRSDEPSVEQVWCTYDSQVGGKINPLRRWWQCLSTAVPQMGYYPGASKTNLIVKPQFQEVAIKVFKGKGIKVTTKGHEMLGSTISATLLAEEYTSHKVKEIC